MQLHNVSELISVQFALEMCLAARNRRSRSSKVIKFSGNPEPVFDFLLVINSNLGPIEHCY